MRKRHDCCAIGPRTVRQYKTIPNTFDIIESDDDNGATTIAIRGQIDNVLNTLDTYNNPTSDRQIWSERYVHYRI